MKIRLRYLLFFAASSLYAQNPATVDETARFLAGLPVTGALAPLMSGADWQQHAREMEQAWTKKESQQILPIRNWMAANGEPYFHRTDTMFYMFSGPDFLYANVFFPYANTYILAGLEPVGQLPDLASLSPEKLGVELAALRGSMGDILRFQYFITKEMQARFGRSGLAGTVPILSVFMARLGYQVLEVAPVTTPAEGVRILFQDPARQQTQTLYYFKTDLSGNGKSAFFKWCAERGPGLSLLKAASFLMHGEGFSGVRSFLLEHSQVIVQDDSGIPLRAFPKGWMVRCYGRYIPHRTTFAKYTQPDLSAVYQRNPPSPLGFAFGYHWQKEEGILMMAAPMETAPESEPPPILKALPLTPEEQAQETGVGE